MKIKKLEKLQDLLDEDIAWRKKELIDIKLLIHLTQNPTLCRVGIALLSAHFEGFIKQAANYYVVYVASQKIKLSELRTNFAAIHSGKVFDSCAASDKITVYQKAIDDFLANYTTLNFQVRYSQEHPVIKTKSNPSSIVVKNIFDSIGLDFSAYETKVHYIDTDLLSNRHSVVHGEKIHIEISDFDNTFKIIMGIMKQFSEQIQEAAINKNYLKIQIEQ
ncbi:MAE_28990/MAE_18760 family HEPN-like nuclease [Akkermansia massiliensis]